MAHHHLDQAAGPQRIYAAALVAAFGFAPLGGCTEKLKPDIAPCPCAEGYVCCESGVCARDQAACSVATRALSESVQGVWTGYLENFSFGDDDALKIEVSVGPDGALTGTVVFGNGPPPPEPQGPAGVWPPGTDPQAETSPTYVPGFAYTIRDLAWQERRLKFSIPRFEPWQTWCALQTSYAWDDYHGEFTCDRFTGPRLWKDAEGHCFGLPNPTCERCDPPGQVCKVVQDIRDRDGVALNYCCHCAPGTQGPSCPIDPACDGAPIVPTDCPRVLCYGVGDRNFGLGVCRCDANGCTAPLAGAGARFGLDIALQDDVGSGSLFMSGREFQPPRTFNLRLTRTFR